MKYLFNATHLLLLLMTRVTYGGVDYYTNKDLTVRGYVEVPSYTIELKSKTNPTKTVKWMPNLRALTGVDVAIHEFLGVGAGFAGPETAETRESKGVTDYNDYRLSLAFKSFHLGLFYQQYKGFFIDNTTAIDPSYTDSNRKIQEREMKAGNISANFTYVLDPDKFSYMAALDQTARQDAHGGSWVLGASYNDSFFSNDNGMIPASIRSDFATDGLIKSAHFYQLNAKVGYGYTFAWTKEWFTSLLFDLGFGYGSRKYSDGITEKSGGSGSGKADAVISAGYNGDSFLATIVATADMTSYSTEYIEIPSTLASVRLFIGGHF